MTILTTALYRTFSLDSRMLAVHAKPSAHRNRSTQGGLHTPLTITATADPLLNHFGRTRGSVWLDQFQIPH